MGMAQHDGHTTTIWVSPPGGLRPAPADLRGHLVLRSVGQRKLHVGLSEGHGLGKRGGSACVGLDILDVSGLLFGYVS